MEESENNRSSLTTAGLVLGIVALVLSFIPIIRFVSYPLGGLGVIFGVIGLVGKKKKSTAIAALIIGIVAIVITATMQQQTINAAKESIDAIDKSVDDMTGKNTDAILKNDLDVTIGEFKVEKGEYLNSYELPVTVKNKGKEKASFTVKIEAVDSNGNRIDEDTIFVDSLNAGQSQEFKAFSFITEETGNKLTNAKFKILEVSKI